MGQPIVEYLERIDATLAPFDGRFDPVALAMGGGVTVCGVVVYAVVRRLRPDAAPGVMVPEDSMTPNQG